jgi:hypothetical protein
MPCSHTRTQTRPVLPGCTTSTPLLKHTPTWIGGGGGGELHVVCWGFRVAAAFSTGRVPYTHVAASSAQIGFETHLQQLW